MQRVIAILLIFCLGLQIIGKLSVIAVYSVNKQIIVDLFCINKSNEALNCEASCFMNEHVNKKEEQKAPQAESLRNLEPAVFFVIGNLHILPLVSDNMEFYHDNTLQKERSFTGFVFHPPQKLS